VDPLPLALARKPRELTAEEKDRFAIGTSPDAGLWDDGPDKGCQDPGSSDGSAPAKK
jgi:hypothetical protein